MFKDKRPLLVGVAMLTIFTVVACGSDDSSAAPIRVVGQTATGAPTAASAPTTVPDATSEPVATTELTVAAISPTAGAVGPATARSVVPNPSATTVPALTATPEPAPEATATSAPTPAATNTPAPIATSAPEPTTTPAPIATEEPVATGGSVTLTPSQDNTLYEDATGSLSSGAGTALFIGATNGGSDRRALVQFDIASTIPDGATISSVSLLMTVTKTIADTHDASLHLVSMGWGDGTSSAGGGGGGGAGATDGDATWTHAVKAGSAWSSPGGDFESTASATVGVAGNGGYTWESTDQLVADVQAWLDDPDSNFRWIVIGDESSSKTAKRFASREASSENRRPQLVIEYSS